VLLLLLLLPPIPGAEDVTHDVNCCVFHIASLLPVVETSKLENYFVNPTVFSGSLHTKGHTCHAAVN
jgi:hypothetical protein